MRYQNIVLSVVGIIFGSIVAGCSDSSSISGAAVAATPPPLMIKDQGSFFVGGELLNRGPDDDVTINQMYVQYQIPDGEAHVPVVMTHGCCLSSKIWETTPDGRMGWSKYFVRQGYPVYLTDQTGRARSGFNATVYNQVANGEVPPDQQPLIRHVGHQEAWDIFRFGPTFGEPFEDGQFPTEALDVFWKQMIPDLNSTLPERNPNWDNLAVLAGKLGGAVLVGHSQSGRYPLEAAISNADGVRGLVVIETGQCWRYGYTEDQLALFAGIPLLIVFGDHLAETFDGFWQESFDACNAFVDRINNTGGDAKMLYLPELGIFGNSHILMQDKNSLQIADLILDWIAGHMN